MSVSIPLFLKPGQELEEGSPVTAADLRRLAANLHARVLRAAELVEALAHDGWACQMGLYDVACHHPDVTTDEEAEQRLRQLGIKPDEVPDWYEHDEDEEELLPDATR